ncbi:hypothetical protein KCU90_g250, partial [Aureobasidium melanogenum]
LRTLILFVLSLSTISRRNVLRISSNSRFARGTLEKFKMMFSVWAFECLLQTKRSWLSSIRWTDKPRQEGEQERPMVEQFQQLQPKEHRRLAEQVQMLRFLNLWEMTRIVVMLTFTNRWRVDWRGRSKVAARTNYRRFGRYCSLVRNTTQH